MSTAFITTLGLVCALSVVLTGWCLYKGREIALPVTSSIFSILLILLIMWAASQPINRTPSPPFILYGAVGPFAWVGSLDQSPPRTYLWSVPNELQEKLQESPLKVEKETEYHQQEGNEYFPYGEWRVSPLTPERIEK